MRTETWRPAPFPALGGANRPVQRGQRPDPPKRAPPLHTQKPSFSNPRPTAINSIAGHRFGQPRSVNRPPYSLAEAIVPRVLKLVYLKFIVVIFFKPININILAFLPSNHRLQQVNSSSYIHHGRRGYSAHPPQVHGSHQPYWLCAAKALPLVQRHLGSTGAIHRFIRRADCCIRLLRHLHLCALCLAASSPAAGQRRIAYSRPWHLPAQNWPWRHGQEMVRYHKPSLEV